MPVLTASSSSARQLFLVLRCIGFSARTQVQISAAGLRFSVDDARSMQGLAFLEKALFTSFSFDEAAARADDPQLPEEDALTPTFQINMPALLETLQIFGSADQRDPFGNRDGDFTSGIAGAASRTAPNGGAFDTRTLGLSGLVRLTYEGAGHPLSVHLEDGNVTTTADLVAYEPDAAADIPFDRGSVALKIVLRAAWLLDAVSELSAVAPDRVAVTAAPAAPFFALAADGSYGSVSVEYDRGSQVLETFQAARRVTNVYKFAMFKAAARAMAAASKVSIRGDAQGVLNMQFMIEGDDEIVSFVDFRMVPYIDEDGELANET